MQAVVRVAMRDVRRQLGRVRPSTWWVTRTVRAEAVVDVLLGHLAPVGHELVLFDVNRLAGAQSLPVDDPGPLNQRLLAMPQRTYALTVITHATPRTLQVKELWAEAGSGRQTAQRLALE